MTQALALAPAPLKLPTIAPHPSVTAVRPRVPLANRRHFAQVVRLATSSHRILVRVNATRQLLTSEAVVLHLSLALTASSISAITRVMFATISAKNVMITQADAILATAGMFLRQAAAIGTSNQLVAF